ncbi:MAG: hypothetical protein RL068_11, partial [Actinomycetota bacterium]
CSEVIGQIPEGLDVVSVGDLKSAISAIEDYQSGKPVVPISCENKE